MSNYLDNLVKCFNNSNLGVNLTTLIVDDEPWFIAKEVASICGYKDTKKAITDHVDESDQKMLSYEECKELFSNLLAIGDTEECLQINSENTESFSGGQNVSPKNPTKINSQGMKLTPILDKSELSVLSQSDIEDIPDTVFNTFEQCV